MALSPGCHNWSGDVLVATLEQLCRRSPSDAAVFFDLERAIPAPGLIPPDVGEESKFWIGPGSPDVVLG